MTHYATRTGTACGRCGPVASKPTCDDCKDIGRRHPYLILTDEQRADMARMMAAQIEPPDRR